MHTPPSDAIRAVFTRDSLIRLHARPNMSGRLKERLAVLAARGPDSDSVAARVAHPPHRRARKAAWEVYLRAAFALGLFDEPYGADLRARLTSADDDAFRAAMAECMSGWLLCGKLGLRIGPRPEGRKGHPLEYLIHCKSGDIRVEVKSPYRAQPGKGPWWGDDSDLLAAALRSANSQFDSSVRNLLIVAPSIRTPVYQERGQLARAFYGQPVITFPVDILRGGAAGPARMEFSPDGSFFKSRTSQGATIKSDGTPPFTRVGAVLCVEEELKAGNPPWMDHRVLVAHNPHASHPVPSDIWGSVPQLLEIAGEMAWNDGRKAF